MKFYNILIILLLIPTTYGITEINNTHDLIRIEKCFSNVSITDKNNPVEYNYNFINFTRNNNIWYRKCVNLPFDVILNSYSNITYDYNFELYYELDQINKTNTSIGQTPTRIDIENENNKRFYSYEGLRYIVVEDNSFKWPELTKEDKDMLFLIFEIVLGICSLILIVMLFFIFFKNKDDEFIDNSDKDLDDFFRKNI